MKPLNFVIVGAGTAGWMAALLMAHTWRDYPFTFTLVASDTIPSVGVGEGSTPALKKYFDHLGIAEDDWMPACEATYKTGIEFSGWSGRPGYERYFHAFDSALDLHTEPAFFYNTDVKRKGVRQSAHPDDYYINAYLARAGRLPKAGPNFPFAIGYGYHFDATRLATFLKARASRLGVLHKQASIKGTERNETGDIVCLKTDTGETLAGDFFIDCSGFAGLLIENTLQDKWHSYSHQLLNDRALALAGSAPAVFKPQTRATAMNAGWLWQIPLRQRTGQGYVYSSQHLSDAEAEAEMRRALGAEQGDARLLQMRVGRREHHWHHNCLAVGLSQGFIEPLEATALNLVQSTLEQFIDAFELGGFSVQNRSAFNTRINAQFDGVRDYIVAHYVCSQRRDTDYWCDAASVEPPDALAALLAAWHSGEPLAPVIAQWDLDRHYTAMSWYSLLAGMGLFPETALLREGTPKAYRYPQAEVAAFLSACAGNFPLAINAIES